MTTPREIVAEYARLEAAAGGLAKADPLEIAHRVAAALAIDVADVRAALLNEWATGGSG